MNHRQPMGICCWYATRTIPRVVAWLCLLALTLNLCAPVAWASLMPAAGGDTTPICHEVAPESQQAPVPAGDAQGLIPHCPLCVLFGGTSWAPPVDTAVVVIARALVLAAAPPSVDVPETPRHLTLRPSPRAPPSSI